MGRPVSSCLWIVSLSGAFIDDDDGCGAPGPFLPSFLRFPPPFLVLLSPLFLV